MRILPTLFALMAASCSQPSKAQPLSPAAFRDSVVVEIAEAHPGLCIEKQDAYTINIGRNRESCSEAVVSTAYVYKQYLDDPTQLRTYVAGLTASASAAIETLRQKPSQLDRSLLVVVIRPAAYAEYMRANENGTGGIWRPFVGDLIAVLVQKNAEQSRSVTSPELREIRLSEPEAWDLALRNLRAQVGTLKRSVNAQGAEAVTAESGLAASILWLPETCKPGGPDFDAFVVARDTYFSADQRTPTATAMLAAYAAQLVQSGEETYSDTLISCIDGRWHASIFDGNYAWRPVNGSGG